MDTDIQQILQQAKDAYTAYKNAHPESAALIDQLLALLTQLEGATTESQARYFLGTVTEAFSLCTRLEAALNTIPSSANFDSVATLRTLVPNFRSALTPLQGRDLEVTLNDLGAQADAIANTLLDVKADFPSNADTYRDLMDAASNLAMDLSTIAASLNTPAFDAARNQLRSYTRELNQLDSKIKAASNAIATAGQVISTILSILAFLALL